MNPLALLVNPWFWLAALVSLGVAGGGGYWRGHHDAATACEAEKAEGLRAQAKADRARTEFMNNSSGNLESENAKAKIVYKTITREVDKFVDRPVYRNVCLDADGLRSVNAALLGEAPDPGKPDGAVPAAGAPSGRDGGRGGPKVGGGG